MEATTSGAESAGEEASSTTSSSASSSVTSSASLLFINFMKQLIPADAAARIEPLTPSSGGGAAAEPPMAGVGVSEVAGKLVEEAEGQDRAAGGSGRIDTSDDDAAAAAASSGGGLAPHQLQRIDTLTQKSVKSAEYRQLFHLPPEEMLIEDFNCALQKKILLQGHMYLFDHYVCFYSNIFGYEKKKVIPLKDVTCVRKARTAGVFPNALEIVAWGKKVSMRASLGELGRDTQTEGDKPPGATPKGASMSVYVNEDEVLSRNNCWALDTFPSVWLSRDRVPHFFASFLSRDEAFRLIMDGWVQHSSYAKCFLSGQESLASFAVSPKSRRFPGENGGLANNIWQSSVFIAAQFVSGESQERRVDELATSLVETVETRDEGTAQFLHEHDEGTCSLEDEGRTSNASSSSQQHSLMWETEDVDAPQLGESYKIVLQSEFSDLDDERNQVAYTSPLELIVSLCNLHTQVDAEEFFQLFFSDEGIGFTKNFHTRCGDDDFRCTHWAKHRHFGHARDISFRHPINFYFGPKSTYCHEGQRFRVYRNNHLVLETSQQMTDIPYGDYFCVQVRWDVEPLSRNGESHCSVRIALDVSFSKKTMWKSRIEQGTFDESKEAYTTWIQMAQGVIGEMKSLAANHLNRMEPAAAIVEEMVEASTRSQNGYQILSSECFEAEWRGEEFEHNGNGAVNDLDKVDSIRPNTANSRCMESEGALDVQSQPEWARKASHFSEKFKRIAQQVWQEKSVCDMNGRGKQLKMFFIVFMTAIIIVMQVGIILTLVWPQKAQLVPSGYHNSVAEGNPGTCFGAPTRDDALAWLERRALHIREEIAVAEVRLQSLHQDLAVLKVHAEQYHRHLQGNGES